MDEIVFQRETLRRALVEGIALLDQAAEAYDPERDRPLEDAIAMAAIGLSVNVRPYADAITSRIEQRTGRKIAE